MERVQSGKKYERANPAPITERNLELEIWEFGSRRDRRRGGNNFFIVRSISSKAGIITRSVATSARFSRSPVSRSFVRIKLDPRHKVAEEYCELKAADDPESVYNRNVLKRRQPRLKSFSKQFHAPARFNIRSLRKKNRQPRPRRNVYTAIVYTRDRTFSTRSYRTSPFLMIREGRGRGRDGRKMETPIRFHRNRAI